MTAWAPSGTLTAIVPTADLDRATSFYARLGFVVDGDHGHYRMLRNGDGGTLHLTRAVLPPGHAAHNQFGLYLYAADVAARATAFAGETFEPHGAEAKLWGMTEFSLLDPDGVLVRVGWPTD